MGQEKSAFRVFQTSIIFQFDVRETVLSITKVLLVFAEALRFRQVNISFTSSKGQVHPGFFFWHTVSVSFLYKFLILELAEKVRKRKTSKGSPEHKSAAGKVVSFEVEKGPKTRTDFSKSGGFQKAVAVSKDSSIVVTAGADGFLRVWKVTTSFTTLFFCKIYF